MVSDAFVKLEEVRYILEACCELDFTDGEAMSEMQGSVHVWVREAM